VTTDQHSASAGEGKGSSAADPASPPADANDEGDGAGSTEDDGSVDDATVRDAKLKKLSDEAARYRTERNTARESVTTEKTRADTLALQNAFLVAAAGHVTDLDAAWKLADQTLLALGDDGTVSGAETAVEAVRTAYPYLVAPGPSDTPTGREDDWFRPTNDTPSGMRTPERMNRNTTADRQTLEAKFPALRNLAR